MKELIIKYFQGHALTIDECIKLMESYMVKVDKSNPDLISKMLDPMNPFAQGLLQKAVDISARSLAEDYAITKVYSKEGNLLMVY